MKRIANRIATAIILLALASTVASAKVMNRTVTFGQDFTVAGTLVKAGTYRLSFDDTTSELSVIDRKTKQVVAKTVARAEKCGKKDAKLDVEMLKQGGGMSLASFVMHDANQIIRIGESSAAMVLVQ